VASLDLNYGCAGAFGHCTLSVRHQARVKLENAFEEIKRLKDRLQDENLVLNWRTLELFFSTRSARFRLKRNSHC
jgi:hypothetical protein